MRRSAVQSRALAVVSMSFLLLAGPLPSAADGNKGGQGPVLTLGVETGRLLGSTLYHITVPTGQGTIESELEWSLDSWLAGITATAENGGRWRADLSVLTNLSGGSGAMEDSDWLDGILFVFSESEVETDTFSALVLDVSGKYRFVRSTQWTLEGVAGLLRQSFDLTASNLRQYSPVGIEGFNAVVAGPVVTYSVSYTVPYLGAVLTLAPSPKLSLALEALGGYARGEDEDDHLLRFKRSRAETDGFALMGRMSGEYAFSPRFSLTAALKAFLVETSGDQSQIFYGGPAAGEGFTGIPVELDARQVLVALGARYRF
jgi:outer membrane protease